MYAAKQTSELKIVGSSNEHWYQWNEKSCIYRYTALCWFNDVKRIIAIITFITYVWNIIRTIYWAGGRLYSEMEINYSTVA